MGTAAGRTGSREEAAENLRQLGCDSARGANGADEDEGWIGDSFQGRVGGICPWGQQPKRLSQPIVV